MKKFVISTVVFILSALVVLSIHPFYQFYQSNPEFTTASPNSTYRVYVRDRELENHNHQVRFNVTKNEKPIIENEVFYTGSNPYLGSYPEYTWVAENILRFGGLESKPSMPLDEVLVMNQTDKVIPYLKVEAGNDFLLLELQPQTETRLFARQTNRTASSSWVGGYVKFADDRERFQWGRGFTIQDKYTSTAHYCVIIKEEGVVVQSREFDSISGVESGKMVEVPVAKNPFCQ